MDRLFRVAGAWALSLIPTAVAALDVPDGFELQAVVSGPFQSNPVGFAFLPDGRILLLEKNTGNVRLAVAGSPTSTVIFTVPAVPFNFESGLLGVAVDPSWPARPFIYVHASQTGSVIQVIRYTGIGEIDNGSSDDLQLIDPYIVLGDLPDVQGFHQGGTLRFGPEGYLYVSIGDDGTPCFAQNRTRLNGKILRIDVASLPTNGGGPPPKSAITPPTNPYVGGGNENEALVYAYGFRNPFRFTIDPLTNDLFVGDVGENTWEEVSKVPYSAPGGNFGWPEFEGPLQDPLPGSTDCSTGPFATPLHTYLHPLSGPASVICGPIVRPVAGGNGNFPAAYHGNLFVAEFYAGWIKRFVRDASGSSGWQIAPPVPGQEEFENWAIGLPFISDLQIGPDGALYFMNLATGTLAQGLYRIVYDSTTDAADRGLVAAAAFPNPMRVGSGLTIRLATERLEAASLRVFDLAGRLVHESPARSGVAHWDGRTRLERPASAGIYVYRIETASGRRISGKVTLIP